MRKTKITIITVCYNSSLTIRDTIESVLAQTYVNYEYLIVDGKSKDNTIEIIKEYIPKFKGKLKYISEKDKGLYDAINKGINMASGDVIGLINSDDILASNNAFSKIAEALKSDDIDGVYSNIIFKDQELNKTIRTFKGVNNNYKLGLVPPHPTLYLKKEVFEKYGNYNINYKIAADYDFMIRILKNGVKLNHINDTLVFMRTGGISTNGLKGYINSFKDSYKALKANEIKFPFLINVIRTFKVIKEMILR